VTKRAWTDAEDRQLRVLRSARVCTKTIALVLGRSKSSVTMRIARFPCPVSNNFFDALPPEVVDWLCRITPENANLADTVRSIIQDAYADETQ
jgi:hypothetical protein